MSNEIISRANGQVEWTHQAGDYYEVSGVDRDGRRFATIRSESWGYAAGINLYQGTKWLVRDGRRYLIVRVYN
jgi:hypothetical protein